MGMQQRTQSFYVYGEFIANEVESFKRALANFHNKAEVINTRDIALVARGVMAKVKVKEPKQN